MTRYGYLIMSAAVAGVINSVAGGGTLLTFPALTAVIDEVTANGTSTIALMPGSLAGTWGYRRELLAAPRWSIWLILPSMGGGLIGTLLVTRLPSSVFKALVPWLILCATILFLLQPSLNRQLPTSGRPRSGRLTAGLVAGQFLIAIYGGYFGAGMGIVILATLGLMGFSDIHQMNAVKTVLAVSVNVAAAVVFVIDGRVNYSMAGTMAIAAIVGGYFGAAYARQLDKKLIRGVVIAIGMVLTIYYFCRDLI